MRKFRNVKIGGDNKGTGGLKKMSQGDPSHIEYKCSECTWAITIPVEKREEAETAWRDHHKQTTHTTLAIHVKTSRQNIH